MPEPMTRIASSPPGARRSPRRRRHRRRTSSRARTATPSIRPRHAIARGERRAGHQRREVADGVAPALVLLAGEQQVVGQHCARGSGSNRDQRGHRPRIARALQGEVGGPGAALVRDGQQQSCVRHACPASSNAWTDATAGAGQAGTCAAHRPGRRRAPWPVLGGAAAGGDDRLPDRRGGRRIASASRSGAGSVASRPTMRSASAGSAAIISVIA